MLVADEVQTGFGRTGTMFACEWSALDPDLMCLAKSLSNGFPLSAVVGRAAIMNATHPGARIALPSASRFLSSVAAFSKFSRSV